MGTLHLFVINVTPAAVAARRYSTARKDALSRSSPAVRRYAASIVKTFPVSPSDPVTCLLRSLALRLPVSIFFRSTALPRFRGPHMLDCQADSHSPISPL